MSERDLFIQCIPMIAQIIVECRKMDKQQYEEWKKEWIETIADETKEFAGKVFIVIDEMLAKHK